MWIEHILDELDEQMLCKQRLFDYIAFDPTDREFFEESTDEDDE